MIGGIEVDNEFIYFIFEQYLIFVEDRYSFDF